MIPSIIQIASASGVTPSDPLFAQNKLLLPLSKDFVDLTGHAITNTGGVLSGTDTLFGYPTCELNGSSAHISIAASADYTFAGDYTLEGFVKFHSVAINQDIFSNYTANTAADWVLVLGGSGTFEYYPAGSTQWITAPSAPSLETWIHWAVTRQSGVCHMWIAGQAGLSTLTVSGTIGSASKAVNIGSRGGTGGFLNAAVANQRVTNGTARYTAPFTPPAGPFPTH